MKLFGFLERVFTCNKSMRRKNKTKSRTKLKSRNKKIKGG